jgi:hypothetical protein
MGEDATAADAKADGLSLAFVQEDLPARALASCAVVTTAACLAMTQQCGAPGSDV